MFWLKQILLYIWWHLKLTLNDLTRNKNDIKAERRHKEKLYVGEWQQFSFKEPFSSTRPGVSADPSDRTAMRNVITSPITTFTTQLECPDLSAAYHYSWIQWQVNWVPLLRWAKRPGGRQVYIRVQRQSIVAALWALVSLKAHLSSKPNQWPNETLWLQSPGQVYPLRRC